MTVHVVLREEELAVGEARLVAVGERELVVYRLQDGYYALNNYCPHQGAPMLAGRVGGTNAPSDVYCYRYDRDGEIVRCPWHGWEFDIKSGRSLFSERVRVKSYPVVVEDGKVGIRI